MFRKHIVKKIKEIATNLYPPKQISTEDRSLLSEHYAPHNNKLRALLKLDLKKFGREVIILL